LILAFLLPASVVWAEHYDWQTLTSLKEVRRMEIIGDSVFMATSGGLLVLTDLGLPGYVWTNVDGLGTIDITDMTADDSGQIWISGLGRLIRWDGTDSRQFLFFDEEDELIPLYCLVDDGDFIWIGSEVGLVYFSKHIDGGQIQDSYGRFGDLPDFPNVNDIRLDGDSIWLATSAGLAVADRTDPKSLKFPSSWTVFGSSVLGSGMINRVVRYEGDIYAATTEGIVRLSYGPGDTNVTVLPVGASVEITELRLDNDSLFYYSASGMGVITGGTQTVLSTSGLPSMPSGGLNTGVIRLVNVSGEGIYYNITDTWNEYLYTGMPGNITSGIAIDLDGVMTVGFSNLGVARQDGWQWYEYDINVSSRNTRMASDQYGTVWAGTYGNGLFALEGDSAVRYKEDNSTLIGNNDALPGSAAYVVVYGIANDGRYLYTAAYRAYTGDAVAIADLENIGALSGWDALGIADGLSDEFVSCLDAQDGQVAVGNEYEGIYVCDVGADPFERPSQCCRQFTEDDGNLRSNSVHVVKYAPDGVLWVGTPAGLCRYDWGIDRFVDVDLPAGVDRDVRALAFDGRGNLWVGTRKGLARFDITQREYEVFTTMNSGLVNDQITSLTLDDATGDLYIGTAAGINIIPSDIGTPVYDVAEVLAFPNPFVIRSADDVLRFNFGNSGTIMLYSLAGERVRELDVNETWDGRNETGREVADGVYLYVLTDSEGNIGRGKILLVRQ